MADMSDATVDQGVSVSFLRIVSPSRVRSLWNKSVTMEADVTGLAAVLSAPSVQWL